MAWIVLKSYLVVIFIVSLMSTSSVTEEQKTNSNDHSNQEYLGSTNISKPTSLKVEKNVSKFHIVDKTNHTVLMTMKMAMSKNAEFKKESVTNKTTTTTLTTLDILPDEKLQKVSVTPSSRDTKDLTEEEKTYLKKTQKTIRTVSQSRRSSPEKNVHFSQQKSSPAHVPRPTLLQAYSSQLEEVTQPNDHFVEKKESDYGYRRSQACQQYLINVKKELHCTSDPHFETISNLETLLQKQSFQTKLQSERFTSIEKHLQALHLSVDRLSNKLDFSVNKKQPIQADDAYTVLEKPEKDVSSKNGKEAFETFNILTEAFKERLIMMDKKIEATEKENRLLVEFNKNLSNALRESQKDMLTIKSENKKNNATVTHLEMQLEESKISVRKLRTLKTKMMNKLIMLRKCRRCTASSRSRMKQYQDDAKKQRAQKDKCTQRLKNSTITLSKITQEIIRLKASFIELKSQQTQAGKMFTGNQKSLNSTTLSTLRTSSRNTSITSEYHKKQKQLQCGKLTQIGNPVLISPMERPNKKCGVWMKDTYKFKNKSTSSNDKIWSVPIPGRQACSSSFSKKKTNPKDRKDLVLTVLFQYASEEDFRIHRPEALIQLPKHKQMESTGAVIYNGSLYYQRRNSRRIIKFDIESRQIKAEKPLKNAGFHGMFAYQWGGYSDVDLAVDEFGLWVAYSSTDEEGDIIVARLNADNLDTVKIIRTNKKKSDVANSFVLCGILYTITSYSQLNSSIEFAYNLILDEPVDIYLNFKNLYKYNTMIDYNPSDQKLYSWDNGRRVVYQLTMKKGSIEKEITTNLNKT